MSHQGRAAQRNFLAIMNHLVVRATRPARCPHRLQRRNVLGHRHWLCAAKLHRQRVAFHMIAMRVAAQRILISVNLNPSFSTDDLITGTVRS